MREEYSPDVILTELLPTSGALPTPVAQILLYALLAEHMKAAGDRHLLESVFTH